MNWNYRREGLWRSLGLLLVIILVIVGMNLDGSESCVSVQSRIVSGDWVDNAVIALFGYLMPLMAANRVMRDHPDWVKNSEFERKFPWWLACKERLCVVGRVYWYWVSLLPLYKPQVQQTNLQDQIDIIQTDHDSEQKVDQVLGLSHRMIKIWVRSIFIRNLDIKEAFFLIDGFFICYDTINDR